MRRRTHTVTAERRAHGQWVQAPAGIAPQRDTTALDAAQLEHALLYRLPAPQDDDSRTLHHAQPLISANMTMTGSIADSARCTVRAEQFTRSPISS